MISDQLDKIKLTLVDKDAKIASLKLKLTNLIKKNPQYNGIF